MTGKVLSMGISSDVPALTGTEPTTLNNLSDGVNKSIASVRWRKPHHFSDVNQDILDNKLGICGANSVTSCGTVLQLVFNNGDFCLFIVRMLLFQVNCV